MHADAGQPSGTTWQPKLPLVAVALFFAGGIVLQEWFRAPWQPVLLVLLGASLAWLAIAWRPVPSPWSLAPLLVAAGAFVTAAQIHSNAGDFPRHLHRLALRLPQHLVLRGVVVSDPAWRRFDPGSDPRASPKAAAGGSREEARENMWRGEFELRVAAVRFHTAWEPAEGRVLVRVRKIPDAAMTVAPEGALRAVEYGRVVEIEGVLAEPPTARNFGLFDYADYLRRQGILHVMQVEGTEGVHAQGIAEGWGWLFRARQALARRLTLGIGGDALAVDLIRGMLLGYREDIPPDVNDSFRKTGTFHVIAISGSHISLIALALLVVLRQARWPQAWACVLVLPILAFYVAATGLRASAVRSLVMAAVVIAGWSLRRPSALLNNLAASALIILAWDPWQLFDAGFQLSFVVVAALILLAPPLDRALRAWVEPDPFIPRSCLPRWRLTLARPLRALAALVAVCLAAWIGSFGLTLHYFNLVSLVALLANLLVVPLASFSVGLGLISLILGSLWSELGITINMSHALLMHLMAFLCQALGSWRVGWFYAAQPPLAWTLAGYAIFGVCFKEWMDSRRRRALLPGATFCAAAAAAWLAGWLSPAARLDVMDVGGGQAILITGPRSERILVDAGRRSEARFGLIPFLRSRGVNGLDLLVLTHGDAAHYGGTWELLDGVPIRRVIVSRADFLSKGYHQLLEEIERRGIPISHWSRGDGMWTHGGHWLALWPGDDRPLARADDLALALRWSAPCGEVIFGADLGQSAEARVGALRWHPCDLLIQGLHTSEDSMSDLFLEAVHPRVIVANTAEFPLRAYPSAALRERWKTCGARIFRTDQCGGVVVRLAPRRMTCVSRLPTEGSDF